jgi:hypothetical protein
MSGYAVGFGNVTDSESKKELLTLGQGERLFSGNWAVYALPQRHSGGIAGIGIEKRFNLTKAVEEWESYALFLDKNREPAGFFELGFKAYSLKLFNREFLLARPRKKILKMPDHRLQSFTA